MSPMPPSQADSRWNAVLARAAGTPFVYAVRSTGIYCRPSCPSRKPRRRNVVFFETAGEAERAGYRACRRCHPREAASADPWVDKVRRACVLLASTDRHPTLAELAARIGGSPSHLQRNFTRIVGVSPREFADAKRLEKVRARLRTGADATSAVFDAGYGSSSRFYTGAQAKLGMTPSNYRKGGGGLTIRYAIARTPLDLVLVAATDNGICRVAMGASSEALARDLAREFPRASIEEDPRGVGRWTKAVLALAAGRRPHAGLPIDVRATAFQRQVWKALQAIPRGEARTYAEVARAIGRPQAVRAVARACATNPVALVVPCHRVVPKRGGTGGYRWGAARKARLLNEERRGG